MKTPLEYLRDYVKTSDIPEEWYEFEIAEMMRDYATYYHEQQVESVDLADVVGRSEQLVCDIEKGTRCKDSFPSYKDGKCHNCGGQAN